MKKIYTIIIALGLLTPGIAFAQFKPFQLSTTTALNGNVLQSQGTYPHNWNVWVSTTTLGISGTNFLSQAGINLNQNTGSVLNVGTINATSTSPTATSTLHNTILAGTIYSNTNHGNAYPFDDGLSNWLPVYGTVLTNEQNLCSDFNDIQMTLDGQVTINAGQGTKSENCFKGSGSESTLILSDANSGTGYASIQTDDNTTELGIGKNGVVTGNIGEIYVGSAVTPYITIASRDQLNSTSTIAINSSEAGLAFGGFGHNLSFQAENNTSGKGGNITLTPGTGSTGNGSIILNGPLTGTSTATSTLAGGINITKGCYAVNGTCLTQNNYGDTNVNSFINSSSTIPKTYTANIFTSAQTLNGSLTIASLNGPLQANNGVVSATTSVGVLYGGTGLTSAPSFGNILVGNALGGYTLTSTSSLGIPPSATSTGSWRNQTGTVASVNTYTPSASSTLMIAISASIRTISAGTLTITCTYTNTDGVSSTATFFPMGLTVAGLSSTGSPALTTLPITPLGNTPVTVAATFSGVSINYDIDASILPIGSATK